MKDIYSPAYVYLDNSIADTKKSMWNRPKIIIAGMTKVVEATYEDRPLAIGVGAYAIYDFNGFSPYYILGLLNSKYTSWYLRNKFKDKHLAGGYLAINKTTIEQLPFIIADANNQKSIINDVKKILVNKRTNIMVDSQFEEQEIDKVVYHLYGLTYDEVLVVDPETPITREEFEKGA